MTKKKKVLLIIVVILLIVVITLGGLYFSSKKAINRNNNVVKTVDKIDGYDYSIKENDSKIKRYKFKELKSILSSSDIDYEQYALKLGEIASIDIYDLNSKINKYDVGGLEYVLPEHKDKLKLKLQDTLYNNIEDNIDKDRKQDLPVVTDADATSKEKTTYELNGNTYDCYVVEVTIDYKEDLGYDNTVSIKMIQKDNKLYIVLIEPI